MFRIIKDNKITTYKHVLHIPALLPRIFPLSYRRYKAQESDTEPVAFNRTPSDNTELIPS